jgi:hypothetical protein
MKAAREVKQMPKKTAAAKARKPKVKVKDLRPRKDPKGSRKAGKDQQEFF